MHRRRLIQLGCHEDSDHVFIAVATRADRYLVSEDSDFGKGHGSRVADKPGLAGYLMETLGLTVDDASEACIRLSATAP